MQIILISFLGTAGLVGYSAYLINKRKTDNTEAESLQEGTPANIAKRLGTAIGMGYFPDETTLIATVRRIPSRKFYNEVVKAYHSLYNENFETTVAKLEVSIRNQIGFIVQGLN